SASANFAVMIAQIATISSDLSPRRRLGRYAVILALLAVLFFDGAATRQVVLETLSEAYIAVTVFVAFTLLIFHGLESQLKIDTGALLNKYSKQQIAIAAILGALPGCGGAIMVVTQYSIGRTSFGAIVAVLTATMGDAAILLIAKEPLTGLMIMGISVVVGAISGYIVEAIHGRDFMSVEPNPQGRETPPPFDFGKLHWPWIALLALGIPFGLMAAFQVDIDAFFGLPHLELTVGVVGALLSVGLWIINPSNSASYINRTDEPIYGQVWGRTVTDTCFVTVWVIFAFLLFELTIHWTGWDLAGAFATTAWIVPLIAVMIGLLPGCGPQVLVTTLYLQGIVPLSAQIGNAISNDGDALFPAFSVAPKATILATIYTAVPALILSYAWFFIFEVPAAIAG
ncbi:MAG: putative manganese transporter, partial [Pseudomonadota bacterium]